MSDSAERLVQISYSKGGKTFLLAMPSEHAEWAEEMLNLDRTEVERAAAEKAWNEGQETFARDFLKPLSPDMRREMSSNPYRRNEGGTDD